MNTTEYKNIIQWTIKHIPEESKDDSITVVNEILKNCGIPLPKKDCSGILNTLIINDYMGWEECTSSDAQIIANGGTPTIGVSNNNIVIIEPQNEILLSRTISEKQNSSIVRPISQLSNSELIDMTFFSYTLMATGGGSSTNIPIPERIAQNGYTNSDYKDPAWDASLWSPYERLAVSGCAVACTSMALSCIGINRTPSQIIAAQGGSVVMNWGKHHRYIEYNRINIDNAVMSYKTNPRSFAPPIVNVKSKSNGGSHYIVVCDYYLKNGLVYFRAIDPAGPGREYDFWNMDDTFDQAIQYDNRTNC